jgi:hypothetical protein
VLAIYAIFVDEIEFDVDVVKQVGSVFAILLEGGEYLLLGG